MSEKQAHSKVGIVILNYKNAEMTVQCLDSLRKLTYPEWTALVVDNCSCDGSVECLRVAHPDVPVLETESNLGYAGGNKAGYEYYVDKQVDYLWLLNNDTKVDPSSLAHMVAAAESDPKIGAVGCLIRDGHNPDDVVACGGGRVSLWSGHSSHTANHSRIQDIHFVTGASLLVPMRVIEVMGFLDEGYFLYYEDTDYSLRLRKSGYKLLVATGAVVYHYESGSIGRRSAMQCYYCNRAFVRFMARNAPFPLLPITIGAIVRFAKRVVTLDWIEIPILAKAFWDGWKGRHRLMGPWRK